MSQAAVTADRAARSWQTLFLTISPSIEKALRFAFRHLAEEKKEESIQAALTNACLACARLWSQGRANRIHPTALARYAVAQTCAGRLVGSSLNSKDVLSGYAQRQKRWVVKRLEQPGSAEPLWFDALRAGCRTPVPDQVWFRIDFPLWLAGLSPLKQKVAHLLASGHSTNEVARTLAISAGRVSQIRRELSVSWQRFHGEVGLPLERTDTPYKCGATM